MPINMIPMIPELSPKRVVSALSEVADWGQTFADVGSYQKSTRSLGEGVNVAVLDTGIAAVHPDLAPNIAGSVDFTNDDRPFNAHGTHVAGIIAAATNGIGIRGVAPEAKLYSVRVLDANGFCPSDFRYVIRGLEWVLEHPSIDIVNISLGAPIQPPERMHRLIRELTGRGVIIVAASGNEGSLRVSWPARFNECVAVAAMDRQGNITDFSNRDETLDILAPGVEIYSTWMNGCPSYAKESGTSMSCPFITGLLALMLAYHRDGEAHDSPLTNYLDAISHLQTFQHGRLVSGISKSIGIGVVGSSNLMARRRTSAIAAVDAQGIPAWRLKLYQAIDTITRRVLLGGK